MNVKAALSQAPYRLGLDIGIASVGWCLLGENRIIALGVRAFDKAESEKGESLNAERREKRLMRRRLRRRAHRLLRARRLFKRQGLLAGHEPALFGTPPGGLGPWELRATGLQRRLEPQEWARALYHLLKFRGFHSNRKSEAAEDEDTGKLLAGINGTQRLMEENGCRTPAELAARHADFASHKRNKAGGYGHTFARAALAGELALLFQAQRGFGNSHADAAFEDAVRQLFWAQRPPLTGEAMLKLMGHCTFEPAEFRAPKHSHSAERFVWLSKLNNLYVMEDGTRRPLSDAEREAAQRLPFERNSVSYKTLRTAMKKDCGFPDSARFAGLSYRAGAKDPEEAKLMEAKGWHALRQAYEKALLNREWQKLAIDTYRLDAAGYALTVLKTDEEIRAHLAGHGFSEAEIAILLPVSFKDFVRLSVKAIAKLLPYLEEGRRYDDAATAVYGDHRGHVNHQKTALLPPIDKGEIRNPVVFRAMNQARKVVNAIVRQYGQPLAVNIELARDLSRNWEERQKIKKGQEKFRDDKENDTQAFEQEFGYKPHPKNQDLQKWRLYREQDGKCAYSLFPLAPSGDVRRIFDPGQTQIDHILPYSRSFDDGQNNKVLVLARENQDKGNRTPYEYLDGANDSQRWLTFAAWVKANPKFREAKRQRLLRKHFDEREAKEFRERNLTDTRYIGRYCKNLVENHLQLAETDKDKKCVVLSGQLTAFLRARWGLLKNREDSDLHHALDAAVVAACSHGLVKRLSDYSRRGELDMVRAGYVDPQNGEVLDIQALRQLEARFPQPWEGFRGELLGRLAPQADKPVLVSRAPKRRGVGEIHKATLASLKGPAGKVKVHIPLQKLTIAKLDNAVDAARNEKLINALRVRLSEFGGDAVKAFADEFRKPSAIGKTSPIVRSIAVWETQKSGAYIRNGVAELGEMLGVEVYRQNGGYHVWPLYAAKPGCYFTHIKPPDKSSEFCFTLHKNDLVKIEFGREAILGYFVMYESDGRMTLRAHDQPRPDKKFFRRSVAGATSISKYHVDVLGRIYKAQMEVRRGLAQRGGQ